MIRFLTLMLLLVASPVLAEESAHGAGTFLGLPVPLWKTLNMLAFFALLVWLLAKPLRGFFQGRRETIGRDLDEAERQSAEAARIKAEVEGKVASLGREIETLRERLRSEGEREREALERQGEAEAARLLSQIEREADRRVDEARTELAREAAEVAAELAWELLEREITPADRERIFRTTLERLRERTTVGVQ